MASQIDICNIALSNIGCLNVQSLTDETESARLLTLNWERCLDGVLREFPWNFATVVRPLNLSDDFVPGYEYGYVYPFECKKLWEVYRNPDYPMDFVVRFNGTGKFIATNAPMAFAKYTVRVDDTSLYDPSFTEALIYKLAYEIANAKTGNSQLTQEMGQRYQIALAKAYHDTATEGRKENIYPKRYIDARR